MATGETTRPVFLRWASAGVLLVTSALGLWSAGCSESDAGTAPRVAERPRVLRVGISLNDESVERRQRFEILTAFLEKRLGIPVELVKTTGYGSVIEAMRAKKLDIASLGPFGYLIGHEKTGLRPLVVSGYPSGVPHSYHALMVVPAESPLRSIDDVKRSAKTLTFAWTDPASTTGHLIPRAYLESEGLVPEQAFNRTLFTNSHTTSILSAKAAKVDLAAIDGNALEKMERDGRIASGDVRVIWKSEPVTASLFTIRGDFSAEFEEEVRRAFLAFCHEEKDTWARFEVASRAPGAVWVAAKDEHFAELRAMAKNLKTMRLLE